MLKIKKSESGLLLNIINKFNNLRNGYAYDKNYEKITHIEFEMERQKEVMVKLKLDLANKNKELLELTLKNKNDKKQLFNSMFKTRIYFSKFIYGRLL